MQDLTIIIPARNEMFLKRTIDDIFEHIEGDTHVIAILDGQWANEPIPDHERLTLIHHSESVGQRRSSNEAASIARSKYLMKVDAHCSFDQGFDVKMISLMEDDMTCVPIMRNLHAFDWVCEEGHRRYQSPSGPCKTAWCENGHRNDEQVKRNGGLPTECEICKKEFTHRVCGKPTTMDIRWIAKTNPINTCYRFDKTMHFKYWNDYGKKLKGDLTETLSIQGSCFMLTKEKWFELDICSESFNSWGQQGVEVACKTWLSGGRVLVNRTTWYAHLFRTQGGDFGFPYDHPQSKIDENRELSKELFRDNKWEKAVLPFEWLIAKFNPPEW